MRMSLKFVVNSMQIYAIFSYTSASKGYFICYLTLFFKICIVYVRENC